MTMITVMIIAQNMIIVPISKPRVSKAALPKIEPINPPAQSETIHKLDTIPVVCSVSGNPALWVPFSMYISVPRYVAADPRPCNPIETTVNHRFDPKHFRGGIGPKNRKPVAINKFPIIIVTSPSKPLSVRNPKNGVKTV